MKVLSSNSLKGIGKYNNDIYGSNNDLYYVMDGATALFEDNIFFQTSDLYEYMHLLNSNIKDSDSIISSLKDTIRKSNQSINKYDSFNEYVLPTFTIAAIKEYDKFIDFYVLCDCLIAIMYKDKTIEIIEDNRFNLFKNKYKNDFAKIDILNLPAEKAFELKMPIWKTMRKFANKENGYPVGSTDEKSIDLGLSKRIVKEKIDSILICSDGFYKELGIPNKDNYFDKTWLERSIKNVHNDDDLTYVLLTK